MVATGEDKLAEGTLEELDDADYTKLPTNVDYAYVRLNKKAVVDSSTLVVKNEYVDVGYCGITSDDFINKRCY